MNKTRRYSPEVRERAVRMVFEHEGQHDSQCAAIRSITAKIGCSAETLRKGLRQTERDAGRRPVKGQPVLRSLETSTFTHPGSREWLILSSLWSRRLRQARGWL